MIVRPLLQIGFRNKSLTSIEQWHYVPSKKNPADLISRGIDPIEIQQCEFWWSGPPFLQQPEGIKCHDNITPETNESFLRELKSPTV